MLADTEITAARVAGELKIDPFNGAQLRGASYVLRLSDRFRSWILDDSPVDMWSPGAAESSLNSPFNAGRLTLHPGEFVLGASIERIGIGYTLAGTISPLSHIARFGLSVTLGADLINPGFGFGAATPLTLELFNHNRRPLVLTAGMPIAHLRLVRLTGDVQKRGQRSIYDGADPVVAPKLYEEWQTLLESDS